MKFLINFLGLAPRDFPTTGKLPGWDKGYAHLLLLNVAAPTDFIATMATSLLKTEKEKNLEAHSQNQALSVVVLTTQGCSILH
jgi:hypothetical protein